MTAKPTVSTTTPGVNGVNVAGLEVGTPYTATEPIPGIYDYTLPKGEFMLMAKHDAGVLRDYSVPSKIQHCWRMDWIALDGSGTKSYLYADPTVPLPLERSPWGAEHQNSFIRKNPIPFAPRINAGCMLGTDPELFVLGSNGVVLPAFSFLETKTEALAHGMVNASPHTNACSLPYWDGFQAEYTVKPIACIAHLTDCVRAGIRELWLAARKHDKGARLTAQPVMVVAAPHLTTAAEEHVAFGCAPSENVYGEPGLHPGEGRECPVRFAGFHMHFSIPDNEHPLIPSVVKLMDKLCGVMSVAALQGLEDPIRRRYYGLAGEHRLPRYGLEWRVLSSAVLWHPAIEHLHFNIARAAMALALGGLSNVWEGSDEEARGIINDLDVTGARRVIERNRDIYAGLLRSLYIPTYNDTPNTRPNATDRAHLLIDSIILPGFREHIELDIEKNWYLGQEWTSHSSNKNCMFAKFASTFLDKHAKAAAAQAATV